VTDDRAKEMARLLGLGATRGAGHDAYDHSGTVMADPEGNQFCIACDLAHVDQGAVEAASSRSRYRWEMATGSPLEAGDPRDPW
jgi:Glyoxalase-like domain